MADNKPPQEEWLSAKEAAKRLGINDRTLIRMVEKAEITGYRISNAWKFKPSDIDAYIESHRYGPDRPPE